MIWGPNTLQALTLSGWHNFFEARGWQPRVSKKLYQPERVNACKDRFFRSSPTGHAIEIHRHPLDGDVFQSHVLSGNVLKKCGWLVMVGLYDHQLLVWPRLVQKTSPQLRMKATRFSSPQYPNKIMASFQWHCHSSHWRRGRPSSRLLYLRRTTSSSSLYRIGGIKRLVECAESPHLDQLTATLRAQRQQKVTSFNHQQGSADFSCDMSAPSRKPAYWWPQHKWRSCLKMLAGAAFRRENHLNSRSKKAQQNKTC